MLFNFLKSKIHHGVITEANVDYEGSLTVDVELMEACGMRPYERVTVVDLSNGNRFDTYLIEGQRGSRVMCANGGAALLTSVGNPVIVMCYALVSQQDLDDGFKPNVIRLDKKTNAIVARS